MRVAAVLMLLVAVAACGGGTTRPDPPPDPRLTGACGYSILQSETTKTIGAAGGTISIVVTTTSGAGSSQACTWAVVMSDAARSFMTLVEPSSGTSSAAQATVVLNVSANTGGQRQTTVAIADVNFTVTQAAAACAFNLSGDVNASFPASGGTGRVTVTRIQGAGCPWSASSNAAFIAGVTPGSGSDDGPVTFVVQANTGPARTGTLTIAGQIVTVSQAAVDSVSPTIGGVSPTTIPLGSPTALTINGSGFDAATAQIAVTGPACPAAAPCVVTNAEMTTHTSTQIIAPVTLRNAGVFTLQVRNGAGGPLSNGVAVTVVDRGTAPVINSVSPTQMSTGTQALTIIGSGFTPDVVQLFVTGPSCAPCLITNGELTMRTPTQLVGPATLRTAGTFTIQVQNGSSGPLSNGLTLTVVPPRTPSITAVSPVTISLGVTTALTISGADFDPASVQIALIGPGCAAGAPCIVTNGELTSRSSSQIVGPVTLRLAGTFTIQVQNGSGGGLSNPISVTVR